MGNYRTSSVARKVVSRRLQPSWQRYWRYWFLRLMRIRGKSIVIARSVAIGVFAGSLPLFGLQIAIAVLLAYLFRSNKFLAMGATWYSNPLTYAPLYLLNFQVGSLLLQTSQSIDTLKIQSWADWQQLGQELIIALLFGSLIVGAISAMCAYFLCLFLVRYLRRYRRLNRLRSKTADR